MPFLLIAREGEDWPFVDEAALKRRLCPYVGPLHVVTVGDRRLYHTRLGHPGDAHTAHRVIFSPDGRTAPHVAWACVEMSMDGQRLSTDPLGQVPLWRHDGPGYRAWAPEAKAFGAIAGFRPHWKPDSQILAIERRDRTYSPYQNIVRELNANLLPPLTPSEDTMTRLEALGALGDALETSAAAFDLDQAVGAWLSGGIDSSVATALLARRLSAFSVYTLGTRLGNEFTDALALATHLNVAHHCVHLDDEAIGELWSQVIDACEIVDGMAAEIALQVLALARGTDGAIQQVVTGYGSDLLFGGMLGQAAYLAAVGVDDTAGLIERTRWSMELAPFALWALGIQQVHLYWHPAVMLAAMRIPTAMQTQGANEKAILRATAVQRGWLLREHAYRPKLGMSIGTGVNQLLSRHLGQHDPYAYPCKSQAALGRLQTGVMRGLAG